MTLEQIISLCRAWDSLGDAIQSQVVAVVLDGEGLEDQNPNALRYVARWLGDVAAEQEEYDQQETMDWAAGIEDFLEARDEG